MALGVSLGMILFVVVVSFDDWRNDRKKRNWLKKRLEERGIKLDDTD